MSEYAAAQLLDLTDTLLSHSLTRVHRTSPRGIHTARQLTRIAAVNFRLSVTPLMSTDPRPGHVLKTASASEIFARLLIRATCAQTTLSIRRAPRYKRGKNIQKLSSRRCLPTRAWMRGFSRFISILDVKS